MARTTLSALSIIAVLLVPSLGRAQTGSDVSFLRITGTYQLAGQDYNLRLELLGLTPTQTAVCKTYASDPAARASMHGGVLSVLTDVYQGPPDAGVLTYACEFTDVITSQPVDLLNPNPGP